MRSLKLLAIFCASLVAATLCPFALAADVTAGLVGQYTLDGNAEDATGNGHHGTVVTGPTWTSDGIGGAAQFSYAGEIDLPAAAFATVTDQVTLSFWCKGGDSLPAETRPVEGLSAAGNRLFICHLPWDNGRIYWDAGYADGSYDRLRKSNLPAEYYKGRWNHIALVKNAATGVMEVFVNGESVVRGTGMTKSMAGVAEFAIGRDYDGLIDDFRVYDRALSAQEVTAVRDAFMALDTVSPARPVLALVENPGYVVELSIATNDNLNVAAVEIIRNGTVLETVNGNPATFRDSSVSPSTTYSYTVRAKDGSDNWSATSEPLEVTTGTDTFPGTPGKVVLKQWFKGDGSYSIAALTTNPRYPDTPYSGQYLSRTDAPQNVSNDGYGCRMEGWITPEVTGNYVFYLSSDDASELWLAADDSPTHAVRIAVVEDYTDYLQTDQYPGQTSEPIRLVAGAKYYFHAIQTDVRGSDHLTVQWQSASVAKQIIPAGNLFAPLNAAVPPAPNGLATTNLTDRLVELTWNNVADDVCLKKYVVYRNGVVLGETVGYNAYRDVTITPETTYDYTVKAVDVDGGESAASTPRSVTTPASPTPGDGTGLAAKYWNNSDFTGALVNRVDSTLDFEWLEGAPAPSMGSNYFSAIWSGKVKALYTADHVFTTLSDDGVRVYLDNRLIIDYWSKHSAHERSSAPIRLVAGEPHDIRVEYFERRGNAVLKLYWESDLHLKEIVPQTQLFPDAFAHGDAVVITSATEQAVSPAWLEGRNGADAASLSVSVNGGAAFDAVRMGTTNFYGDSESTTGKARGIALDPAAPVTVVASTPGASDSKELTWVATDLTTANAISIRKGSSLLLTATGSGAELSLDVDSDGTIDFVGAPGDKVPAFYGVAGTLTATATIDGAQVGTLVISVVDYAGVPKIGNVIENARTKDLIVTPRAQTVTAWSNPGSAVNLIVEPITDGVRVVTNPTEVGSRTLYLRLGGDDGPVITPLQVDTFELFFATKYLFPKLKAHPNGTILLGSCTQMAPHFPGYEVEFKTITSGTLFEESGTTRLWQSTSDFDKNGQRNVYLLSTAVKNACHKTGAVREEGE